MQNEQAVDFSKEFATPEKAAQMYSFWFDLICSCSLISSPPIITHSSISIHLHPSFSVKLKAFSKFEDTTKALAAASSLCEGKLDKSLKKFLKQQILGDGEENGAAAKTKLAVSDLKLGNVIKEKLGIQCIFSDAVLELMRGIRSQLDSLLSGAVGSAADREAMRLGLSHSLCRYKLKFSPDKVDTMIIQAIGNRPVPISNWIQTFDVDFDLEWEFWWCNCGVCVCVCVCVCVITALLDELDKELNTYAMRVREWYGWHYPELAKIINETILYAKVVLKMGMSCANVVDCFCSLFPFLLIHSLFVHRFWNHAGVRSNASKTDLSDLLPEDIEKALKENAEISSGTDISEEDILNIKDLCEQVITISEYRSNLFEYLKNRMNAIAPNLTCMVGELVGARLIAHAGSLLSLAKQPASTVQILGAEKALFRALKTKHDTPKYGLIYHASLVGQAPPKLRGKVQ